MTDVLEKTIPCVKPCDYVAHYAGTQDKIRFYRCGAGHVLRMDADGRIVRVEPPPEQ